MPGPHSPDGTAAPRYTRAERVQQVEDALARGLTLDEAAAEMGVSVSHVRNLRSDPSGDKDRARKESYRKPCPKCGRSMSGQDGPSKPPMQCKHCAAEEGRASKRWTREAIIEAIQLFAREHGRPPLATEWLLGKPKRDSRYPPASAVYKYRGKGRLGKSNPFDSWADAIEAAGFPRPKQGHKVNPRGRGVSTGMVPYVVLKKEENGLWSETRVEAHNPDHAINQVATEAGEYVGIREISFVVQHKKPRPPKYVLMPSTPGGKG